MIINRFYTLLAALSIFESVQGGYEEQQDSSLSQGMIETINLHNSEVV